MVRKIVEKVPDQVLKEDLKRYKQMATDLGATDVKTITTDMVIVDDRVRAKCIYPKCQSYGTNANCPPYAMDVAETRRLASSFRHAIFFRIGMPSELLSRKSTPEKLEEGKVLRLKRLEIVSKIESAAFYDGYYLAVGFGGGACKTMFCPKSDCSVLKGEGCKAPLRARSSMEAVGMDVYMMATKAGWDMYPVGQNTDAPRGTAAGIVFIH